jgi:hypothetical protein
MLPQSRWFEWCQTPRSPDLSCVGAHVVQATMGEPMHARKVKNIIEYNHMKWNAYGKGKLIFLHTSFHTENKNYRCLITRVLLTMSEAPALPPFPPAIPATPMLLSFWAEIVPAQWVPWLWKK